MKNLFAYDFTNRTIVATKATLKKASNPTTDEYTALIKMIEGQPTFRVVEKTIKNSGNKKTYKGLTLKMMMDYCSVCSAELSRRTRAIPRLERETYPTPPVNIPQVKPKFPFVDVPTSAWYYDSVKSAWENDLINGVTNSEFRPDENMTVAQAIKLSAALHQLNHRGRVSLKNGSPDWYSTYVDYAIENGLIESAYGKYTAAQMNSTVTRAEFVHIFHAAAKDLRVINAVADNAIPDVKTGAAFAAEIYDFYRAGILTGSDVKGTFRPSDSIKRSEVAAILIRMFDSSARRTITLE